MGKDCEITEEAREWSHHQEIKFSTVCYRCEPKVDFSLFVSLLTRPMKILDLGCNGSYVVDVLIKLGHDAWGTDLPAVARQAQRDHLETANRILTCNLDTGDIPGGGYDLVLVLGVIEHLVNYNLLFKKVSKVLKDNGIVFVTTCNREVIEIERHHYHHFTVKELQMMAESAGFEMISITSSSKTNLIGSFRKCVSAQ